MPDKESRLSKLAERLGFPGSATLIPLLDRLLSEEEAGWAAALPATPTQLAKQSGVADAQAVGRGLHDLFMRGIVLVSDYSEGEPIYVFDHKPGRFMDAILFDPRYRREMDQDFFDLWKEFYNKEMVHTHVERPPQELPFRVVSISLLEKIHSQASILPSDQVELILGRANLIAVQNCPCRTRERNCDSPLETCISLNELAEYMLTRGIARRIDTEEAKDILHTADKLGLVHEVDNNVNPSVVCNCCTCCCTFLRAMTRYGQRSVVAQSPFRSVIDQSLCISCDACVARCHFDAIHVTSGEYAIDQQTCFGCGLCVSACPEGAIYMTRVEGPDYVPTERDTFFKGVDRLP